MKKLIKLIETLIASKFYGELSVKFQNGKVSHVEKRESLDISEMRKED